MKTIIYLYSYHHGNTRKVAGAIAPILSADVVELPKDGCVCFTNKNKGHK